MSLKPPEKVQKLRAALHAKAKGSPDCRFHSLYDKVYRNDVLVYAYRLCRVKAGAPGVDGETFEQIEAYGRERWLGELEEQLREKTYRPEAVRRVKIAKPDGGERPLGIPTVRDRVVQTAVGLVLEPIFEADLPPEQYAYREGRSGLDAVRKVHSLLHASHVRVVDADLSGYFDSIPHAELMRSVARRISDGAMLHLIKMWLQMPVEEEDERGRKQRTSRSKDEGRGIPQGAPISPLLSNLYMRRFVLGWKVLGHEARFGARIVNYADDLVICCRGSAERASIAMRGLMRKLKLTVNETKTRVCRIPDESFDFLGYTIGRCYSPKTGRAYIGTRPSRKRVRRLVRRITQMTSRKWTPLGHPEQIGRINRLLEGWSNYFCLGPVSSAYRAVDRHVRGRLRRWLRLKHKTPNHGTRRYPNEFLYRTLGLIQLPLRTRSFPWANA